MVIARDGDVRARSASRQGVRVQEAMRVGGTSGMATTPTRPVVEAGGRFELARPDADVVREATRRVWSTPSAFPCELKLDVTANGEPFASRTWESEVSRDLV